MSGRKRTTKKTAKKDWKALACAAMALGATVTEAASAAGVNRTTIYAHLDSDEAFRKAFDDATEQGTDVIEAEATRRAVHGVEEPVIYQGKPTLIGYDANDKPCEVNSPQCVRCEFFTVRKPSDTLAIFLLKGRRPMKFRDNVDLKVSGGIRQTHEFDLSGLSDDELLKFERAFSSGARRVDAPGRN